jgi:hypothetical protein
MIAADEKRNVTVQDVHVPNSPDVEWLVPAWFVYDRSSSTEIALGKGI